MHSRAIVIPDLRGAATSKFFKGLESAHWVVFRQTVIVRNCAELLISLLDCLLCVLLETTRHTKYSCYLFSQ